MHIRNQILLAFLQQFASQSDKDLKGDLFGSDTRWLARCVFFLQIQHYRHQNLEYLIRALNVFLNTKDRHVIAIFKNFA